MLDLDNVTDFLVHRFARYLECGGSTPLCFMPTVKLYNILRLDVIEKQSGLKRPHSKQLFP